MPEEVEAPIAMSNLAEQMDMKALIGGLDLAYAAYYKSYLNAMAMGLEDSRASQRRTTQAADAVAQAMLNDLRSAASAQTSVLIGASGARQDTLASTETEQAMANAIQAQERLGEEINRLNAVLGTQKNELGAQLSSMQERTAQLENTLASALAMILAKLDAATNPSTPVGPSGG